MAEPSRVSQYPGYAGVLRCRHAEDRPPIGPGNCQKDLRDLTRWHLHVPVAEDALGAIGQQQ